jgi:hypothetical protein
VALFLLAAHAAYQDPGTGLRIEPGAKLGDAYQEANLPVVEQQLYQAGVRLAGVLNEVFREGQMPRLGSSPRRPHAGRRHWCRPSRGNNTRRRG